MKQFFAVLLIFCLMVVVGLLVLPSFIDWNQYREDLAALLSRAAGQQVAIDGDLEMALLPSPRINARDVRIGNVKGASEADLVRVGEVRMQIAVRPLFAGRVSVTSLLLVNPVVNLESLPDGRGNWEVAAELSRKPAKPGTLPLLPVQFSFDKVSVADGALAWRRADGAMQRLDKLNAQVAMVDLAGPAKLEASASYRDRPLNISLSLGKHTKGQPLQLVARLSLADAGGEISFNGSLDPDSMTAEGKAEIAATDAAAYATALAGEQVAGLPRWPLDLKSPVRIAADKLAAGEISLRLGEVEAIGQAGLILGKQPRLQLRLDFASLDIDRIQASGAEEAAPPRGEGAAGEEAGMKLPAGFDADLQLGAKILRWKGGIVRDAELTAKLEGGVLTLDHAGAQLPGGTNVTMSGKAANEGEAVRFDGDLAAISDNLRAALAWAGVGEEALPADRLRAFSYTSRIVILPDSIALDDIKSRLDATRITGAAVVARRARPSFGVSLDLDRLDLDAYLAERSRDGRQAGAPAGGGARPDGEGPAGFDANFDLAVGDLSWRDKQISGVIIDAQLFKGELALRKVTARDLGGAALSMSGTVRNLAASPRAELDISLDGRDSEAFAAFMGFRNMAVAGRVGRFNARGRVAGNMEQVNIDATLDAIGGTLSANGTAKGLDGDPAVDLALNLNHSDGDRVLALAMPDRRAGKPGPLQARMKLSGGGKALSFSEISGDLGGMAFSGALDVALSGERPGLTAEFDTGVVMLDRLFPPRQPSAAGGTPAPRGNARWSREPIDLKTLQDFDLRLSVKSEALVRRDVRIDGASLRANLNNGQAVVEEFAGTIFGGALRATGRLDAASGQPGIQGNITGRNMESLALLAAVSEFPRFRGPVSLDIALEAKGRSEFDLVSSLAGRGTISGNVEARLKEEERAQAGAGALLGLVLGDKVRELGAAGDAVAVLIGAFAVDPAALSGDFTIDNGVARTENLLLDGKGAKAVTKGAADLPNWTIDSNTALYRGDVAEPYMTLGLRGVLDAPDIRTGGTWLKRRQAPAPVQPAAPQTPAVAPAPQPEPAPAPKKKPKPEDFILDILKSLQ